MAKKLIEVALPLEAINAAAAYEKMPGIGSHPRGLHLWWARRPFVAARAVIFASLVDDPAEHTDLFPTEAEQNKERERLFHLIKRLVRWQDSNDEDLIAEARSEILKYVDGDLPVLLDPFAGGGAIPYEAQRLGLEAHAHDLNPVAVMINKAMIEIPTSFVGGSPVNPEARKSNLAGAAAKGVAGLAEDVRYYGEWVRQQAFDRIGSLYPRVIDAQGNERTVVAWLWARTVASPNPAAEGAYVPLVSSFLLSKKKGSKAWVEIVDDSNAPDGWRFEVKTGALSKSDEERLQQGTKAGKAKNFICHLTDSPIQRSYVQEEGKKGRLAYRLMAIVASGDDGRIYLSPNDLHQTVGLSKEDAEEVAVARETFLSGNTPTRAMVTGGVCSAYGLSTWGSLFTGRQLVAMTTFSDLIAEAKKIVEEDAIAAGLTEDGVPLCEGGTGARAYGEAISIYLAFAVDRLADFSTCVSRWSPTNEKPMNCFNKQAIAMTWDFPEANPFGNAVGSFSTIVNYISDCMETLYVGTKHGEGTQFDAQADCGLRNVMISTDPPYYDNIGYADLSDFFYVWLRKSLRNVFPELFHTMFTPKADELVATPYRFGGSIERARAFFETGMLQSCLRMYQYASDSIPVTIYYAYKQNDFVKETDNQGAASTGWETMLSAIIQAGFAVTGTWPMRTEQAFRSVSMGTNALASSIVLVCRKRGADAQVVTRRNFIAELKRELRPALKKLQESNIAPVDMAQSAIGPGIGVFSKYRKVLEADGTEMSVRSALQIINQELDIYFNEQDGELDRNSRFCVELYTQFAFNDIKYGEADTLARAKNTSVGVLASAGVVYSQKGIVHLLSRDEIPEKVKHDENLIWLLTQQLTRIMETKGIVGCAEVILSMFGSNADRAKDLAYRLFTIAEKKGWAQEAYAYNALVTAWPDIQSKAAEIKAANLVQLTIFD